MLAGVLQVLRVAPQSRERADMVEAAELRVASDTDVMLDDRARREYRARLAELQREIDEAERDSDLARSSREREEMDALVEALAGALAIGGRSRALGSGAERARCAVSRWRAWWTTHSA